MPAAVNRQPAAHFTENNSKIDRYKATAGDPLWLCIGGEKGDFGLRKKSHITLARYLVNESRDKELKKHKYAFYLGSVLPDIKPSFIYKRHEISGTFPALQEQIKLLSSFHTWKNEKNNSKYYRHLGKVSHYLADYFTYPHNDKFTGGFRAHCSYEEDLKKQLRQHISSGKAASRKKKYIEFAAPEALFDFVAKTHKDYLSEKNTVEGDISHIIPINSQVLKSITSFARRA